MSRGERLWFRLIAIFLPWLTLRRIRMLTEPPYEPAERTAWDIGYERFADECRLNMGLGDWHPPAAPPPPETGRQT